jgi:hypothetical protein
MEDGVSFVANTITNIYNPANRDEVLGVLNPHDEVILDARSRGSLHSESFFIEFEGVTGWVDSQHISHRVVHIIDGNKITFYLRRSRPFLDGLRLLGEDGDVSVFFNEEQLNFVFPAEWDTRSIRGAWNAWGDPSFYLINGEGLWVSFSNYMFNRDIIYFISVDGELTYLGDVHGMDRNAVGRERFMWGTNVNIREEPDLGGRVLGRLSRDDRIEVLDVIPVLERGRNGAVWYKIKFNDIIGYVWSAYIADSRLAFKIDGNEVIIYLRSRSETSAFYTSSHITYTGNENIFIFFNGRRINLPMDEVLWERFTIGWTDLRTEEDAAGVHLRFRNDVLEAIYNSHHFLIAGTGEVKLVSHSPGPIWQ